MYLISVILPKKYVDAIEQNALSRWVSGLSGGCGKQRNRRRVDGSSAWLRLGACIDWRRRGWRRFLGLLPNHPKVGV